MSHDELKGKGNECIKQKKYEEAIAHYTDALSVDPNSFAVYSNRSLAHSKLQRFKEALKDAEKCVALSPSFARGYLRKAVACNGLNNFEEAMISAQTGYKLRGSETICRDCITQWLEANQKVYQALVKKDANKMEMPLELIPTWCKVVSSETWTILLNIILCRLEYASVGVPVDFMLSCITTVFSEMRQILAVFGHQMSPVTSNWLQALKAASVIDPRVHKVPEAVTARLLDETKATASWLDSDVDHLLYPIISPLMGLIVMAIVSRCIPLNVMCTEHSVNIAYCRACLLFFSTPILSCEEYTLQRLGLCKELLQAYGTCPYTLAEQDVHNVEEYIALAQSLASRSDLPNNDSAKQIVDSTTVSIGLAQLRLKKTPSFDIVDHAPKSDKYISKHASQDPERLKEYVLAKQNALKSALEHPDKIFLNEDDVEDLEDLLSCVGILTTNCETKMATDSCQIGASCTERLLQQQLTTKAHSIEEAGIVFSSLTTSLLKCVSPMIKVNNSLASNLILRWKSLHSELHTVLVRLGIGPMYMKVYQDLQRLMVDNTCDSEKVIMLHSELKGNIKDLTASKGVMALSVLLKQSCAEVQHFLCEDEVIFEYCFLEHADGDQNGALLVIFPKNEPIVLHLDLNEVFLKGQKWAKALGNPQGADEVVALAKFLCKKLVPEPVVLACENLCIKKLYLCPDNLLGILPLELLLLPDDKILGEKYAISYLTFARELLRECTIKALKMAFETWDSFDKQTQAPMTTENQPQVNESVERCLTEPGLVQTEPRTLESSTSAFTPQTQRCIIVASPNYDLHQPPKDGGSMMGSIVKAFEFLLSDSSISQKECVQPLKYSAKEANVIKSIFSSCSFEVMELVCDTATVANVISLQSPKILHISTHGFSKPIPDDVYGTFWSDTKSGICLAGYNTFAQKKFESIVPEAGTGTLNSLAVSGMKFEGTSLVFLSTCSSSYGHYGYNVSVKSLAQAFRIAGVKTVIASLWEVNDAMAVPFASYFYDSLCRDKSSPSQALAYAKKKLREETTYDHFLYWSSFICIGEDKPLF